MKINCLKIAENLYSNLRKRIDLLREKNIIPHLVIFKNNNDLSSDKYLEIKLKKAKELGIKTTVLSNFHCEKDLINLLKKVNKNENIHGYIIQLPLLNNINLSNIYNYIEPKKDVEGFSWFSICSNYYMNKKFYPIPCTTKAILKVMEFKKINLESKNVVIINKSLIVGKPLSLLLMQRGATVTICHSKTKKLSNFTRNADIIVVGVGIPNFIKENMINHNSFLIDVGINVLGNKVVGDISAKAQRKSKNYTPVPNGIGKLTIAMLFDNLLDLIENY